MTRTSPVGQENLRFGFGTAAKKVVLSSGFGHCGTRDASDLYGTSQAGLPTYARREEPTGAAPGVRRSMRGESGAPPSSASARAWPSLRRRARRRDLGHPPAARTAPAARRCVERLAARRPDPPRRRHRHHARARGDRGDRAARPGGARQRGRRDLRRRLPEAIEVDAGGARIGMVHDAGPSKGRLERMRVRFPDAGRRRLRPLAHPAARAARRLPDLQPRQPHRAPPPARHTMGSRARPDGASPSSTWRSTDGPRRRLPRHRRLGPHRPRGLPATLVRRGGEQLLFDCGEGTQRQLLRSVGLVDLDEVFLTHFHADHFLGLPGMLKTFGLRAATRRSDLRPARASSGCSRLLGPDRPHRLRAQPRGARRQRRAGARRLPRSPFKSATACGARLRARRGRAPGPLRRAGRASWA